MLGNRLLLKLYIQNEIEWFWMYKGSLTIITYKVQASVSINFDADYYFIIDVVIVKPVQTFWCTYVFYEFVTKILQIFTLLACYKRINTPVAVWGLRICC